MTADTQKLRIDIRRRRSDLTAERVAQASLKIADKLCSVRSIRSAETIAIYMAASGEVDCSIFLDRMLERGKSVFAPILRKSRLVFAPLTQNSAFCKNAFGILEPVHSNKLLCKPSQLDVVITPLVAFDSSLNRLGMGGGYYDRAFAFRKRRWRWQRPRLIGVAYSFQHVSRLPAQSWDVPVDAVITEKESYGSY